MARATVNTVGPMAAGLLWFCVGATGWAEDARAFPQGDSRANLEKSVAFVLSIPEAEMLAIVPQQSGIFFTACPGCTGGAADSGDWEWDPKTPAQLRCKTCGEVYPDNPRFPDAKAVEVRAPDGVHRYPYYENAQGYRIFFRAKAAYFAADYMARACRDLGRLYRLTGDENHARRAALILVRFAEVYPTWAHKYDYPFRQKLFSPFDQNRVPGVTEVYRSSRWGAWAYYGISLELLEGYEAVRAWPGLESLAGGRARNMIERDLFASMVEFVMGFEDDYSNMSPGMWRAFILSGRVLNRPEWIREALTRFDRFIATQFLYDGCWQEPALSYLEQVYRSLLNVYQSLEGYAPPADAPEMAGIIERNRQAILPLRRAWEKLRLPDGGALPIHDTWREKKGGAAGRSESLLMGGLGLALLGGGEGGAPVCAWLNFCGGIGHAHSDALSIGLFARDAELLSDIGYTHTAWRAWTVTTHSHNTVVVNGVRSGLDADRTRNRLRLFTTDGEGFHLAEAESDAAYPGITRRYRRTILLAGKDARDAYLLDIFQVHGGKQHDYLLLGPLDDGATATLTGAALAPFSGSLMNPATPFNLPRAESQDVGPAGGYGFVRNLTTGESGGVIVLDMRPSGESQAAVRTHLLAGAGTGVFLGEAPSIRRAGWSDSQLDKHYAPFFCARRTGANLRSVFIAAHEVLDGSSVIRTLSSEERDGLLHVTVDRGEGDRDHFVMAFDAPRSGTFSTDAGPLVFDGAYGFVRVRGGEAAEMRLVGGARLALGAAALEGRRVFEGPVLKVGRARSDGSGGWLDVAETIGDPIQAALIVQFADRTVRAYNVARVEPLPEGTRLHVVEDPGFEVDKDRVRLVTFPQRAIKGASVRYRLPDVAHWRKGGDTPASSQPR